MSAAKKSPAKAAAAAVAAPAAAPASDVAAAAPVVAKVPEPRGDRVLTGRVVSDKMDKTVTVLVERLVRHESYGKFLRRSTKLLAHDEANVAHEGDTVTITPCRPLSRRKSWKLLAVVEKAAS
ncbi:MAG: 30S ribosomal protein S17 [Proteobacteria bacterium]|nr:30S ribosomal protein S17 [Pseudomonadota bacterium]